MKKLLLLLVAATVTSCGVNRYGVGNYQGMTKSELKYEFKELGTTGVEDKSTVGHAIGGIVTVAYQDPAALAKSENYIVTTKSTFVDGLIGGITGGLYSQNTIHVRSALDGTKATAYKKKMKKKSNVKVSPILQLGYNHSMIQELPAESVDFTSAPNVYAGIGYNLDFKSGFFAQQSLVFEANKFTYDQTKDHLGTNGVDINATSRVNGYTQENTLGIETLAGYKVKNFSLFTGVKAYAFLDEKAVYTAKISYTDTNATQQFESVDVDENLSFQGVHFAIPVGLSYDINKHFTVQGKYNIGLTTLGSGISKLDTAQLGLIWKL